MVSISVLPLFLLSFYFHNSKLPSLKRHHIVADLVVPCTLPPLLCCLLPCRPAFNKSSCCLLVI
jgi:hypothetical protein